MKKHLLLSIAPFLAASASHAAVIAYEGFATPPYSATNTGSTGYLDQVSTPGSLGFTGSWSGSNPGQTGSDFALTYGSLLTTSGAGAQWGQVGDGRGQYQLANPFTTSTAGTFYMSWLQRVTGGGTIGFSGMEFYSGTVSDSARKFYAGPRGGTWSAAVNDADNLNNATSSGVPVVAESTVLYVLKLELSAAALSDKVSFFVNPSSLGGAEPAGATVISTGTDFVTDRIGFANFQDPSAGFDEFRIATTYAEVTPVPEPSTALLGLAGSLLLLRRRRLA
jgi:hypothetical protein